MSENINNSTCGFAEELVSYLYNELNGADKSRFESHLATCESCADELSGFVLTRNSVQEWRTEEFVPLQNPAIEIPYPQQVRSISRSWFASIRDFFTLSPAWMTASTAAAALAICLVLFAVVVSSLRDDNNVVQQTEKGNIKVIPSPTEGNRNQNSDVSETNQPKQNPADSLEPPVPEKTSKPGKAPNAPTKISVPATAKPNNSTVKTAQPKTNDKPAVKQPVKTQKQKAPSFLDDDEETDSLTLTDLLEQIGTREIDD
jgi:Putative zinc-finger